MPIRRPSPRSFTTTESPVGATLPPTEFVGAGRLTSPGRGTLRSLSRWHPTPRAGTLIILATAVAYASTSIFVRQLTATGMSVVAVAFFRFALTATVLLPFLNFSAAKRRATAWGLVSGATMGIGWIAYVRTIDEGDVAVAGVLQMTYPLFAVLAAWLLFATRPTRRSLISGVLILVAAAIGLGAGSSGISGIGPLLFVAPATFGFSVSVLTERLGPLDPFERLAPVALGSAAMMMPLLLRLEPTDVVPQSMSALGWVLAIGAVSALIPMSMYAAAAPVVGTARTAAAGSFELPTLFLIGAIVFGEAIQVRHLVAGLMIVGAILIARTPRPTGVPKTPSV